MDNWGDKIKNFFRKFNLVLITLAVLLFIIHSDKEIRGDAPLDTPENLWTTVIIFAISILFLLVFTLYEKKDIFLLLVYGLYIVTIYSYTFYQWLISAGKTSTNCSLNIPRTKLFHSSPYYLYRAMYLTTLIMIIILIQNLLDKNGGLGLPLISIPYTGYVLSVGTNLTILLPFLLPMLTESVNLLVDLLSGKEYSINPESLLANFMLGDSKSDILTGRLFMPIAFYLLILGYAFISSYYGESTIPIYILLIFMIGFSFWMRTIFVQDCSLKEDKDISKGKSNGKIESFYCLFEKYGGLQAIIATCFLINMLSYIKEPISKIFTFVIICLASGLLSSVFLLNLK